MALKVLPCDLTGYLCFHIKCRHWEQLRMGPRGLRELHLFLASQSEGAPQVAVRSENNHMLAWSLAQLRSTYPPAWRS